MPNNLQGFPQNFRVSNNPTQMLNTNPAAYQTMNPAGQITQANIFAAVDMILGWIDLATGLDLLGMIKPLQLLFGGNTTGLLGSNGLLGFLTPGGTSTGLNVLSPLTNGLLGIFTGSPTGGLAGLLSVFTDVAGLLGNPSGLGTGNPVAGVDVPLLGALLGNLGNLNLTQLASSLFGLLPAALDNLDGTSTTLPFANILHNNDGTATYTNVTGLNSVNTLIDSIDGTAMSVASMLLNLLGGFGSQQSNLGAVSSTTTQPQAVATATAAVSTQTSLTRTTGATTSSGTADIDTFTRTGPTIGSPWVATNTGSGAVATNGIDAYWVIQGSGAATEFDRFIRTVAMTDYHTVTVVLDAPVVAAGALQRLIGRCDVTQTNYVYCEWDGALMSLHKVVAGVSTQLGSSIAYVPHAGDTVALQLGTGASVYGFIASVNGRPLIDLIESSPTSVYGVNNRYGALFWSVAAGAGGAPSPPQFQMTMANYPNGSLSGKIADTGQAITTSYYPSTNAQPAIVNGEYTHSAITSTWEASYLTVPVTGASWMRGTYRVAPGGNNTNGVAMIFWNHNFPEGNIGSHDSSMAASFHLAFTGVQYFIQSVNVGFSVTTLDQGFYNTALAPGLYTVTVLYNTANTLTVWGPDLTNGSPTKRVFGPHSAFQTFPRTFVTFEIQEDNANAQFFFHQIQAHPSEYTSSTVAGPATPGALHSFSIADNTANATTSSYSDNFTRPNAATLGAAWTEEIPAVNLTIGGGGPGNLAAPQFASSWCLAMYNTSLQTDQETTSITLGSSNFSLTNGDRVALLLRSSGSVQIYGMALSGAAWQIFTSAAAYSAFQASGFTSRATSASTFTLTKGDTLTFTAQGGTYTLLQNGAVRVQWPDLTGIYTFGPGQRQAGVAFYGATTDGLSAWSASDI